MKSKTTDRSKLSAKRRMAGTLETHPRKRLGTTLKVKTFKPQRPMTRACTHLKSVLKAAKMAANNKLRKLKKLGKAPATATSPSVYGSPTSQIGEKKKGSFDGADFNTSKGMFQKRVV